MDWPSLVSYSPENPMKRVLSGTSSPYMDRDVVEIPPPKSRKSTSASLKQKEVICYEVIDSDQDEDVIIIGEKGCKNKGKTIVHVSDSSSSNQSKKGLTDHFSTNFSSKDMLDVDEYAMVQALAENADIPTGVEAHIPWWPDSTPSKKPEVEPSAKSDSTYSSSHAQNSGLNGFPGIDPSLSWQNIYDMSSTPGDQQYTLGFHNSTPSVVHGTSRSVYPSFDPQLNTLDLRTGSKPKGSSKSTKQPSLTYLGLYGHMDEVFTPWAQGQKNKVSGGSSSNGVKDENEDDEVLRKLKLFKQFDMVDDYSDHHYANQGGSVKQPPKNWAKKIQEEWKILENDLPDTIFVRVYESRMDLLRAVIIGAEGTPYHDGLFFFDISFPSNYPSRPPHVYYHSGGLRLNPNLYNCGKVCLSLLNTWQGNKDEKWIPDKSTMLQVLVSIQALILNADPYFNEPGYELSRGTPHGQQASESYNESTFLLSLKTMLYSLRRPPKHFEELVKGHFYKNAHGILQSCKAYIEGAQVGSLVKGGVQDVEASSKKCTYNHFNQIMAGGVVNFKQNVAELVKQLVPAFTATGAKNFENFLNLKVAQGNNQSSTMPNAACYVGTNQSSMVPNAAYYVGTNQSSMMPNAAYYVGTNQSSTMPSVAYYVGASMTPYAAYYVGTNPSGMVLNGAYYDESNSVSTVPGYLGTYNYGGH